MQAAVIAAIAFSFAQSPDTALTRREAIQQALDHNPQIVAAFEQVQQARARRVQATALPDPGLSGSYDDLNRPFALGSSSSRTVGLDLTVPFPDKIRLRGKVAGADVDVAQFSYTQLRQLIASQTAQAYDAVLVAQRHERDLAEARQLALDFVKKTEARYEAGTAAKLDVIKAQVDASQVETDRISTERDILNGRAQLNRLLGRAIGARTQLADTLAPPPDLPNLAELAARASTARPEMLSVRAQQRGATAATKLAKEFWLPDLSFGFEGSGASGSPNSFSTGVSIGMPIFFWQHTRGEVAEAKHFEFELQAQARDVAAQVAQEVASAYADASTALRQVVFLRDELLPAAQQAFKIANTSYGLGGASALDVLDAHRALLDAQSQYAEALGAANDAVAQLELAVGGSLK